MAPITLRVLDLLRARRARELGACVVCQRRVSSSDEPMRLPRGHYVHRRCSTYRMRQRDLVQRRLRV